MKKMSRKRIVSSVSQLHDAFNRICAATDDLVVIGGHYAIDQFGDISEAFGIFSSYTFETAVNLVADRKTSGKRAKLALIIDDHSQMPDKRWYQRSGASLSQGAEAHFRNYVVPTHYATMLQERGLSESDIHRSKYGVVFQESKYRQAFTERYGLDAGCSGEVKLILDELASSNVKTVLGYIPLRCQGPTCVAVDYHTKECGADMRIVLAYLPTGVEFIEYVDYDRYAQDHGIIIRTFN
jgi:hypothetical protein